ncbi:uncharacterized protein A1O9_06267 [Exophiala aquamarina CBS 119918]|uniref:Uncharacterized protein n=1 Tax=Exophiala aquamarina CBS 119918 TaxID=1182545 RepID=A0A072PES2_9EURO|nr:uncharacterized protein A1O9_06267 [Exophiala aquamarina CBS 119918]KEF58341.1 hypothetical protein A1O9_06267 [Exophiala aquamarina CBS 119918]
MSESSALALIDKAGTISTKEASSDIKSSLLFTARWESLLMSAPIALSSLGACYVASSSEIARTIKLTIPKDSKLTTPSLPANLVECGNLGTNAFIEAEAAMGSIHMNSKMVDMKVADIINALGDPTMAKRNLPSHLNNLMGAAQECLQRALDMDKKFDEWLEFICDLRVACVEQSSTTEDELRTGKINQLSEKTRLDYQTMAVASAENATKRLEQELTVASEAFKKASDEYPTGWDIVGQQIVSGLADTFNTAVNAAIPVLMQHLSPFKNFTAAAGAVGDFIDDIQDDETPQSQRPPTNGATSTRPSGPAPTASNQIPVPHITDPAYSQINTYMLYLNILNDLLSSGKDKGVNWDKARGSEKTDPKTTAKFLVSMFSDAKQSFAGLATKAQASTDYRDVIETALEVATAVEKEVNKGTSASYELPKGGSALVNLWQQKFRDAYLKAYGLYSTAKALPGNPPNGEVPIQFPLIQSTPLESSTDPKSDQAQAILESAKNRLNTTQEAYRTTQDNFLASAEMLTTQKVRLGEIQSKITDLQMMTMDLARQPPRVVSFLR